MTQILSLGIVICCVFLFVVPSSHWSIHGGCLLSLVPPEAISLVCSKERRCLMLNWSFKTSWLAWFLLQTGSSYSYLHCSRTTGEALATEGRCVV